MGRDFRPKGKGARKAPPAQRDASDDDEHNVADDVLLREVQALGGNKDDVALMQSKGGSGPKLSDAQLSSELAAFMQQENMALPGKEKPRQEQGKNLPKDTKGGKEQVKEQAKAKVPAKEQAKEQVKENKAKENKAKEHKAKEQPKQQPKEQPKEQPKAQKQQKPREKAHDSQKAQDAPARPAGKHMLFDGETPRVVEAGSLKLLIEPQPDWPAIPLSPLDVPPNKIPKTVQDATVAALHALGQQTLDEENATYARLANGEGGKNITLGALTLSDLQFARTLLTSSKASTLSDRISAVTLLLQSSPVHNLKALDTLMTMAGKPSREEAGRATRALADWLASGGGLGPGKLNYFRDQPLLPAAAAAYASGTSQALRVCTCLWAFEDMLKKTYFAFVQLLERQSHDTLLFMRKQAVTQVFVLLRDKAEQEHNLLRLLTNKLGDPDRSVASKASTHLMELLHAHPAMKGIVLREVSETVLRSQVVNHAGETGKGNQHATYYGVLTLNQTLFTTQDAAIANEVFTVYFQLFDVCLAQEEREEKEDKSKEEPRDKKRWRDQQKGAANRDLVNKAAADVDSRLLAAILTGIRRVFPFTSMEAAALDKHLDTLFRITHTHSFNIAIQALQLIFQVAIGAAKDASAPNFSPHIADRYYRTLYDSLLDSRLATTSKQAMYLNLVYKSLKADLDPERVKAFVKRICQILCVQDPPFICGALVLLSELFTAVPGLRSMLTDPEEDGVEHFADADEDGETAAQPTQRSLYDGRKRDPRFAHAGDTALWDILPLLHHFHPSVSLNAKQLLDGVKVTSNADLTLNTLMHFLDRFVFRNPKKMSAVKGSSIMQPALSGDMDNEVLVRRSHVPLDYVNSAAFWSQRPENVPVDQQFFLQFFQAKQKRAGQDKPKPSADEEVDTVLDKEGADEADDAELSTDDEQEKEIWKAMKDSLPTEDVDEEEDDDDDDELLEQLGDDEDEDDEDEDDEDDDGGRIEDDGDEDDEPGMFLEDDDDLVPFTNFDDEDEEEEEEEEEKEPAAGTKRAAEDEDEAAPASKNRKRAEQRRKRRALPAFASADEYAHMLASDDEGNV
ncbi:RNA-binding ribosome biosynthesis protein mak21 [Malassezia japonica]|uniref:RNA-binding ribosome biosynthesis protein mak21 n=1 Tax=Malassezia japonica TaxID=223818 RepID=A0AAF0EV08_9BASI|nr:RNA-binding ribosome biosynthesis protein mak21 [Malassezia japonica]WFD37375.1 RNA-binding ribosome biosynthesis protein mak21 [Malassezia japonica]